MARTKKRKKTKGVKSLKFEVYGILMITFAIISIAAGQGEEPGIGDVGRALSNIFIFLTGHLYFVIPVVIIVLGLYIMMKRKWPKGWSFRKTGVLLMLIGLLTSFHISLITGLHPDGIHVESGEAITGKDIIFQPYENTRQMLTQEKPMAAYKQEVGGGIVGSLTYGVLYFLVDNVGAKLLVIAMFAIGLICLTGWSYAEMFAKLKSYIQRVMRSMTLRMKEAAQLTKEKKQQREAEKPVPVEPEPDVEVSEETDPSPLIRDFQQSISSFEVEEENKLEVEPSDQVALRVDSEADNRDVSLSEDTGTIEVVFNTTPAAETQEVPYQLPPFHLLARPEQSDYGGNGINYRANAKKLEDTLESFGVGARVLEVVKGPSVTRYEIQPESGVKVSRIVSLTDDIALALAAKDIRMEAPIPGKAAIGIEVPNSQVAMVSLREVMESTSYHDSSSKVTISLGRDISGQPIIADLARMPHLLVAGATGSGKSVCINGIIVSILYKAKPDEVKFLMIDPKKVELNVYNGIPHLLAPVVTDPRRASLALRKIVVEMEGRYDLFSKSGTRNIEGYNEWAHKNEEEILPQIVVIVDELADLMMVAASDVEDSITRLAQMARAAGIHLIIATQRPSVNVITGVIKANIPSRIAFGVSSQVDSRTILDSAGAEKLLGRGDMLFLPVGASKPTRIQGAFLSDEEVEAVVQFAKSQGEAEYREELVPEVDDEAFAAPEEQEDELYENAIQIVVEAKQASVSLLQRRMRIGYTRAARLIDAMEASGIVGPYEGSKPREVLISSEELAQRIL